MKRYAPVETFKGTEMLEDPTGYWVPYIEAFKSCGCGFKGTWRDFDMHDCVKATAQAESRSEAIELLIAEATDWNMNNFGLENGKDLRDHLRGVIEKINNGTYSGG